ncbi:hypothetical protein BDR26DRAFT_887992, partial [Obelidium mucronatum]
MIMFLNLSTVTAAITAFALFSFATAAPVPGFDGVVAQASSLVVSACQNSSHNTLAFRALDASTLEKLRAKSLSGTFFITTDWLTSNKQLVNLAVEQGHSIGLSIPQISNLVSQNQPCNYGNCDHPVIEKRVKKFMKDAHKVWNEHLNVQLKAVAFTGTSLLDLRGGHMYANRYSSLEAYFGLLGYTSVLVGFGKDTWNHMTAMLSIASLSNIVGAPYVESTFSKTASFMEDRKDSEESVEAAIKAVEFLRENYNVSFVPMVECLGYSL